MKPALTVAVCALALAACAPGGEAPPPSDSRSLIGGSMNANEQASAYIEQMDKVQGAVGSIDVATAAQKGRAQQLKNFDRKWDNATQLAASIDPPADIAESHAALVAAMKAIGQWNNRIVAAAPNAKRTMQLYSQAQQSPASNNLYEAKVAIVGAGYPIDEQIAESMIGG